MNAYTERREPNNVYQLEGGMYVFYMDGEPLFSTATVGIGYDSNNGTLLKHGMDEIVSSVIAQTATAFRAGGLVAEANALMVVTGRFPLDELNHVINCTGYMLKFADKLKRGEIQPVA